MTSVLVVTTSFAPENAIGSVRMAKLVKYLVRFGFQVTVVSPALDADTPRDETLESAELAQVRRHIVGQGPLFLRLVGDRRRKLLASNQAASLITRGRGGPAALSKAIFYRYVRFGYTLFRNWDWQRQVLRFCRRSGLMDERFDAVFSSYPSLGGMWAAAALRRKGVAPRWVADFRDPVNYETNADPLIYRINSFIQRRLLARADAAIAVSGGVAAKVGTGNPLKPVVLSNGFDPEDWPRPASLPAVAAGAKPFKLAYAGSLYGGTRDITVVFRALRDLVEAGGVAAADLEFHYAGGDSDALRRQATIAGMEGILVDHGKVSRRRALSLQAEADVIVVATWNTEKDQGIMTGKLFECFMMRRPVLGVVNGDRAGSEFKQVVSRVQGGWVFEAGAADQASEYRAFLERLARIVAGAATLGEGSYNEAVEEYSYPRLAASLGKILETNGAVAS